MALKIKLRKVGKPIGLVLQKKVLARPAASNPGFAVKLNAAKSLTRRYRHALKELAK